MTGNASEIEERFAALGCITLPALRWLKANGVPSRAITNPEMPASAKVAFQVGSPFFDFEDELEEEAETTCAMILMARDLLGEPVDLVAWSARMQRVATWSGADLPMLGWHNVFTPRLDLGDALAVHPTPLEWLRDSREGIVILKEDRARFHLQGFSLKVDDAAFGRRIRDALRWPEPKIFVEARVRAAA